MGGRSDVHHAGNTNTISLNLEYARSTNKVNVQLFRDDAVIERLTSIGGGYPYYSGRRIYTKNAVLTNGNPNATTACKALVLLTIWNLRTVI